MPTTNHMSSLREVLERYTAEEHETGRPAPSVEAECAAECIRVLASTVLSICQDIADLSFDQAQAPIVSQPLIQNMNKDLMLGESAEVIAKDVRERVLEAHQKSTNSATDSM